jgi:outer membrane protein assembly factor BamA
MRRLRRTSTLALTLLLTGCLLRAKAGNTPLVGDIHIEGNKHVPAGEIVSRLGLQTSGIVFITRIGDAFPFDPELLRVDRKRVERVYRAFGYYEARVTDIRTHVVKGRINITFVVDEGPPVFVTTRTIQLPDSIPADVRSSVQGSLPLVPGEVVTESGFDDLKTMLRNRLKEAGYWQAVADGHVVVDERARTSTVTVEVAPGPRYTISFIDVTGTKDVSHRRIREMSGLKEGDFLRPAALVLAERRVVTMGVFSQVIVKPGEFDAQKSRVPVLIEVVDAPFQSMDAGAGVEVDPTRQVGRVRTVYTHKNLGKDLQKIIVGGSVGYAFVPTLTSFFGPTGTERQSGLVADLSFQFVQPRIFHVPIDFTTSIDYAKDIELAFDYQRVGAHAGLVFAIEPIRGLTFAPSVNYDYYFDVSSGPPQPSVPGQQASAFATSGCGPNAQNQVTTTCSIGYISAQLNYDQRDDPLSTRSGYFLSLSAEYASKYVSDFNFVRFSPEARAWLPFPKSKRFVLAARIHYGLLTQLGSGRSPPGVARFFSGGATSVRATYEQQLGPREFIVLPNTGKGSPYVAGLPIPVGGDNLLEGNAELRWFSPVQNLVFAVFFDIGRLELLYPPAGVTPVPNTSGGFQYAPGIGVRYYSPFGPIRVDFAYRISTLDSLPVSVDTTNVSNPVASHVPTTVLTASGTPNYRIATTCNALPGQASWQCYQDSRFQFFITLGEAF